jgi:hypothetical protein
MAEICSLDGRIGMANFARVLARSEEFLVQDEEREVCE